MKINPDPGDVVYAIQYCDGIRKAHYGIVTDICGETGTFRVLFGSSKKATRGALLNNEVLVEAPKHLKKMGLMVATRFALQRDKHQYLSKADTIEVTGVAPDEIVSRIFFTAKRVGYAL